jgi:hypothetical protein
LKVTCTGQAKLGDEPTSAIANAAMAAMNMVRILLAVLLHSQETQENVTMFLHHGHTGVITIADQNNERSRHIGIRVTIN